MAIQENKNVKITEKVKPIELEIHDVEENAIIVNIQGWRMRVYFEDGYELLVGKGGLISVEYTGDINDAHTVKFKKLK